MIDGQETFLFGILPIIVGLAIAIGSVTIALRTGTRFQVVIATFLVTAMAMSVVVLIRIFLGAWPTYLPHLIIVGAMPILWVQVYVARRQFR
jgi:hypothetical protein